MLTDEQKQRRLSGVYGSDAAIICGFNPYKKNIVDLWRIKSGMLSEPDIGHLPQVEKGIYFEEGIRRWFEDKTGFTVMGAGEEVVHPEYDWMRGHLDGFIIDGDKRYVFEAKTGGSYTAKDWDIDSNRMPIHYLCQVAHYVAVTNADGAYVAAAIDGQPLQFFTYLRNKAFEEKIIAREKAFWESVKSGVCPDPTSVEEILSYYDSSQDDKKIEASPVVYLAYIDIAKLINEIEEREKLIEELKTTIQVFMGDSEKLVDPLGRMIVRFKSSKPAERFDSTKFKKDNPELYKQYVKIADKGSRPFVVMKLKKADDNE